MRIHEMTAEQIAAMPNKVKKFLELYTRSTEYRVEQRLTRPSVKENEFMEVKCGDIVEVLWPGKTVGYHVVLGHSNDGSVIIAIVNDKEYRNAVIPLSQIEHNLGTCN